MNAPFHALKTAEPRRFTAAEFMKLYETGVFGKRERLRLIGGEVYVVAPTGPEHAVGLGQLIVVLGRALSPRFQIATDPTLCFSERDVTEPDAVVIPPGPRPRPQISIAEIQLVAETAHSSLEDDLTVMAAIYAAAGVLEYWVLDLENQRLVVFRQPEAGGYAERRNVEIGQTVSPLCAPDAAIAIADLF